MSAVDPTQAGVQKILFEQLAQQMWKSSGIGSTSSSDDDSGDSGMGSSGIDQFSGLFAQTLADALAPTPSKKAGA